MENQSFECHAQLAQLFHRLVEILRNQGGSTWKVLVETVSGKTAVIDVDRIQLRLRANGGEQLQIESEYPVALESVNFRSEAETLRDVIAGKLTLDAAVVADNIYVRGSLEDLLNIHQVVMEILANSAIISISDRDSYRTAPATTDKVPHSPSQDVFDPNENRYNQQLRHLWTEFDQFWPRPSSGPPCLSLEHQKPSYGELIRLLPEDVLAIEVYPREDAAG
jgi:hypothetical protein